MKKLICALLIALLGAAPALAGAPQLSGRLIGLAKQAAVSLSEGDYERLTDLPFSGRTPGTDDWRDLAGSFRFAGRAQTEYAVAYWHGGSWRVAVPMETPSDGGVEVLLLRSDDGASFSGCMRAAWSQVEAELASSDHVKWDREYVDGAPMVFGD